MFVFVLFMFVSVCSSADVNNCYLVEVTLDCTKDEVTTFSGTVPLQVEFIRFNYILSADQLKDITFNPVCTLYLEDSNIICKDLKLKNSIIVNGKECVVRYLLSLYIFTHIQRGK